MIPRSIILKFFVLSLSWLLTALPVSAQFFRTCSNAADLVDGSECACASDCASLEKTPRRLGKVARAGSLAICRIPGGGCESEVQPTTNDCLGGSRRCGGVSSGIGGALCYTVESNWQDNGLTREDYKCNLYEATCCRRVPVSNFPLLWL